MGGGLQLGGIKGPWQRNRVLENIRFCFGPSIPFSLQLEYVFVWCLALPLSHCFHWLLFLFCQATKFSGIFCHTEILAMWSPKAALLVVCWLVLCLTREWTQLLCFVVYLDLLSPIGFTVSFFLLELLLFLFITGICSKINMLGLTVCTLHFVLIEIVTFCDLWPQAQGIGKEVPDM